jgi:hypothetical protein
MQSLSRLRAERYSSSSGHRLNGPLLQSYHGSPRHSFRQHQRSNASVGAVLSRVVVGLLVAVLVLGGCWIGGKHALHKRDNPHLSHKEAFMASISSIGLSPSMSPSNLWPSNDMNWSIPRPWSSTPADPEAAEAAAKALKGTRAGR